MRKDGTSDPYAINTVRRRLKYASNNWKDALWMCRYFVYEMKNKQESGYE